MHRFHKSTFVLFAAMLFNVAVIAQKIVVSTSAVTLSAIKGATSKTDSISLISSKENITVRSIKITGEHAAYFQVASQKSLVVTPGKPTYIAVTFVPAEAFIGIAHAILEIKGCAPIKLTGLSTKGLEGEHEAPLSAVVDALQYKINIGWTTLANHYRPELQGDELAPAVFKKANDGVVEMIPVARYSPDFALNFGFYTPSKTGPVQHQAGILAKAGKYPEHQTLFPTVVRGKTSFDPGQATFGFYVASPGHTMYSEDTWNILFYPAQASHAMRIYPVRDGQGVALENTYLVAVEEATNGDYNDYVFIVKNIKPVFIQPQFVGLLNGKNLAGWHTWFKDLGKDNDPNHVFTFETDGVLHDTGKDLGYMITEKSYDNYHFIVEFKWGEKKWPPRQSSKRDSGICYNVPVGEESNNVDVWPASVECQIQEGDVGDFWLVGYSTIQVDGKQCPPLNYSQIVKKKDAEKPTGEWNTVEVISFNGKCAHIVNGVLVNYGDNATLIGGRILLQSEYAEVYYRNVRIREF